MTAAAMTYDLLVADVLTYCERDDEPLVQQIPRFVMLAENRIAQEDKPLGFQRVTSFTLNSNTIAKPVRWRKTKSLSYLSGSSRVFMFLRSYEYCRTFAPDASVTGLPRYYSDYDYEHLFIVPTPVDSYQAEFVYYERPEPLSTTNQTNWLTQYCPQLLFYAVMLEAMPFLKLPERIPEFQALYDRALQALNKEDGERVTDASA
jgi:hypothetical protein